MPVKKSRMAAKTTEKAPVKASPKVKEIIVEPPKPVKKPEPAKPVKEPAQEPAKPKPKPPRGVFMVRCFCDDQCWILLQS